jgi:D-alanyl-D-alanine carboxypeptidase/D-alanyl-D-alanine-endopeptidase (penicillin-binding protein 4)
VRARVLLTVGIVAASLLLPSSGEDAGAAALAGAGQTAVRDTTALETSLDRLFEAPALDGALLAVHVTRLSDGQVIYSRNAGVRVMPASTMKLVTAAVAAEKLGWDYTFETRLETTGPVVDGVLRGDLVVVGTGDPTIEAQELRTAPLFEEWAEQLVKAGVRAIDGRLIGDDNAFDDETAGAGWAWDYLTAAYAPPSGALNYNEGLVAVRVLAAPPEARDTSPRVELAPVGHGLRVDNRVRRVARGQPAAVTVSRLPGENTLVVDGTLPIGRGSVVMATTVPNPTLFFIEGLRAVLASRGIEVRGGAHDIDDVSDVPGQRGVFARHSSAPLRAIVAKLLKDSPNLYGEVVFKAIGHEMGKADEGTTAAARRIVTETLDNWNVRPRSLVMYDGSGLSRYNYVTAELLVQVLERMWRDERHRAPFVAGLPIAGIDGTLSTRMKGTLRRRVQAKTGTISNARALAGYLDTTHRGRLAFAMVANHFIVRAAEVDNVMEQMLELLAE